MIDQLTKSSHDRPNFLLAHHRLEICGGYKNPFHVKVFKIAYLLPCSHRHRGSSAQMGMADSAALINTGPNPVVDPDPSAPSPEEPGEGEDSATL